MIVDGTKITASLARALLALPRYEKYVDTQQCKGCKMIQQIGKHDRHRNNCPVERVEKILAQLP